MKEYRLGLYEKSMPNSLSLGEKLTAAKESGFDYLELSIDETEEKLSRLDWSLSQRAELVMDAMETGIPVGSICLSGHRKYPLGHPDEEVRRRSMEIMEKAIRLACDLSARIIQLAGYDVYYLPVTDETRALFEENLRKSVQLAARYGVILAFETMETDFMNTVQKAMDYVHKVDSPYLQVYPDLGNLTNAACTMGHQVTDDIRTGKGHLAAMHLKETVPGKFREIPYGAGHVNFEQGAAEAWKQGVRLFVGEFWYTGSPTWREDLQVNNAFLRAKVNAAITLAES